MKKIIFILICAISIPLLSACSDATNADPKENTLSDQAKADLTDTDSNSQAEVKKPKIPKPEISETETEVRSILDQINKNNSGN